jgi:hypothetical protein
MTYRMNHLVNKFRIYRIARHAVYSLPKGLSFNA